MFLDLLLFFLVLYFLVVIHELGHYLSGKFFGVKIEEFGLGYPPRAFKMFVHKGTEFTFNWLPLGGFVKMVGEDGPEQEKENHELSDSAPEKKSKKQAVKKEEKTNKKWWDDDRSKEGPFFTKSISARLIIILSGATINFLFGLLAFSIFFSWKGIPYDTQRPRIEMVAENSPAAQSGLPVNVEISGFRINDNFIPTPTIQAVKDVISQHEDRTITLVTTGECAELSCQEIAREYQVYIRTAADIPEGQGALGVRFMPVIDFQFYPWYEMPFRGAYYGIKQTIWFSQLIFLNLGQLVQNSFQGKVPEEVGSPIRLFVEGRKAGIFSQGPLTLLHFAGLISINLAIFNVLPIPALDGGRAVLLVLEKFIGRQRVEKFEGYVNYVGVVFLLALMMFVLGRDIKEVILNK